MPDILEPVDSVEVLSQLENSKDMTESNGIAAGAMFGARPVLAAVIGSLKGAWLPGPHHGEDSAAPKSSRRHLLLGLLRYSPHL